MSSYLERGNETSIIVVQIIGVEGGGIDENAKPFLRRGGGGVGGGQKEYPFHERIEWWICRWENCGEHKAQVVAGYASSVNRSFIRSRGGF